VFGFDQRIRYFGFLDNRQGMILSELRSKEENALHPENQLVRDLTFFKGAMATWSLYFGHVNYSVVAHELSKIVMIPLESGLIIITTDGSFPLQLVEELQHRLLRETQTLQTSKV
jgi:hypothetical protein